MKQCSVKFTCNDFANVYLLLSLNIDNVSVYILIIDFRQPRRDMQGLHTQSEQRYVWHITSSVFTH